MTDSGGASGQDQITLTINAIPVVNITAPPDSSTFNQGDSINFTGTATDAEDGTITANLAWISSIDGSIGSGGSFSRNDLTPGAHTITTSVTDSDGGVWRLQEARLSTPAGDTLYRLPAHRAFWFGWYSAYSHTRLVH